jgi:hypothetical protein
MRRDSVLCLAVAIGLLLMGPSALADPPVLQEGQCVYLVGAPPGGVQAPTEERASEAGHEGVCTNPGGEEANRDGQNMAQAWWDAPLYQDLHWCRRYVWVGHDFVVESDTILIPATVTMEADYRGWESFFPWAFGWGGYAGWWHWESGPFRLRFQLLELDPLSGGEIPVGDADLVEWLPCRPIGSQQLWSGSVGRRLHAHLRPGVRYRARLYLEVWEPDAAWPGVHQYVDFGKPYSNTFAQYDRIQVCVGEPGGGSALEALEAKADAAEGKLDQMDQAMAGLEGKADAAEGKLDQARVSLAGLEGKADLAEGKLDGLEAGQRVLEGKADAAEGKLDRMESAVQLLEAKSDEMKTSIEEIREELALKVALEMEHMLWGKECVPALWLPSEEGGRLDEARAHVERRILEVEGAGDARANLKVARERLAAADQHISAGEYQLACRRLSDALRALTTP